jgi:hypothetical protein
MRDLQRLKKTAALSSRGVKPDPEMVERRKPPSKED